MLLEVACLDKTWNATHADSKLKHIFNKHTKASTGQPQWSIRIPFN